MGYPTLTFQYEGAIAVIALTVPEKRNAVSSQMIADLLAALEQAQESPARVLIITGAGKAFCAGMDLGEISAGGSKRCRETSKTRGGWQSFSIVFMAFPSP